MSIVNILNERGFVHQITNPNIEVKLENEQVTYYAGIDPTANSMHVGHLLPVMAMSWLQKSGHKPIVVIGGGTALIGDPSGKTDMRKMLSVNDIEVNSCAIKSQLERFLNFNNGLIVNNSEWLSNLNYIDFLREIGSTFSVNKMLTSDACKVRLEKGLSFIEFNYQILQAFDFLHLNQKYNCELQIGGSDQWGNIVAGIDLIRRKTERNSYGITNPLITTASGEKMGKTSNGAVWLCPDKFSPQQYFQYWMDVSDNDVFKMLKLYTFLPMSDIAELEKLSGSQLIEAKRILAVEATSIVHGEEEANKADKISKAVSGGLSENIPTFNLQCNCDILDLLISVGFIETRGEGKRLIAGGGVKINNEKIYDATLIITDDFSNSVIRAGRKKAVKITTEG